MFAGWDSDASAPQSVSGLHHPYGDVKKIAFGSITGTSSCREFGNCGFNDIEVAWSEGHTESGSSGSGLFNATGQLVGTLWGGSSQCGPLNIVFGHDAFGRFSDTLPQVERFLNRSAEPLAPGWSIVGQVEQESWRDYRLDIGDSIYSVEVILHELSSGADLYVRLGSKPTLDNFECAPLQDGRLAEFCTLGVAPGNVVYIGVFGSSPTDFRLTINGSGIGAGLAHAPDGQRTLIDMISTASKGGGEEKYGVL